VYALERRQRRDAQPEVFAAVVRDEYGVNLHENEGNTVF
jgi:hypothetical protein